MVVVRKNDSSKVCLKTGYSSTYVTICPLMQHYPLKLRYRKILNQVTATKYQHAPDMDCQKICDGRYVRISIIQYSKVRMSSIPLVYSMKNSSYVYCMK